MTKLGLAVMASIALAALAASCAKPAPLLIDAPHAAHVGLSDDGRRVLGEAAGAQGGG
jgi:hypothetical protein